MSQDLRTRLVEFGGEFFNAAVKGAREEVSGGCMYSLLVHGTSALAVRCTMGEPRNSHQLSINSTDEAFTEELVYIIDHFVILFEAFCVNYWQRREYF